MDSWHIISGMKVIILLSVAPMFALCLIGLIVSLIQSMTQIQEQTIAHLLRLATLGVIIFFFGEAAKNIMVNYSEEVLSEMSEVKVKFSASDIITKHR
jgi:type III secretory pathway component EscS